MKKDVSETVKKLREDKSKLTTIQGRHCCSKHELCCSNKQEDEAQTYVTDTRFPDWYCGVNWYPHLETTDPIFTQSV